MIRYLITAAIALVIGFMFLGFQYWWYAPVITPEPIYVLYKFVWGDVPVTLRASACGQQDGVFHFYSLETPGGWAFISMNNLIYGLCLTEPVPEPDQHLRF